MSDQLVRVINWELGQRAFRHEIRRLIQQCQKKGKVIPLPFAMYKGQPSIDLVTLLLSQVNCYDCDAPCCKANPEDKLTQLLPPEYERLSSKYDRGHFVIKDDSQFLPMPCPFLKNNRCRIYPDRPIVCVIYPFQPGATNGAGQEVLAVASSCPEGRRIARAVYMTSWRIRTQFRLLGEVDFLKGFFND